MIRTFGDPFELGKPFRDTEKSEFVWFIDQRSDRGGKLGFQTEEGDFTFYPYDGDQLLTDHLVAVEDADGVPLEQATPRPQPLNPCNEGEHTFPNEPYKRTSEAVTAVCEDCGLSEESSHLAIAGGGGLTMNVELNCVVCGDIPDDSGKAKYDTTSESYVVCQSCDSEDLTIEEIETTHLR